MIHIKIKEKIKEWLFSSEMLRIKQLEKQIEESTNRLRSASIQHSDEYSWAVICIAGKPEYV